MLVTPSRRLAFFLVADGIIVLTSTLLALALRLDTLVIPHPYLASFPLVGGVAAAATIGALYLSGLYRVSWAFVGLRDVARIAVAVIFATGAMGVVVQIGLWSGGAFEFPRSVVLIQAPITFCALSGFRLSKRAWRVAQGQRQTARGVPTLLVGAGDAGAQILKSIQMTGAPYNVCGFVDDDPLARGTAIYGVRVLGPVTAIEAYVKRFGIEVVILCVASARSPLVQEIVARSRAAGVKTIRIVPPMSQLVDGQVGIQTTREVSLEDLLGREAVKISSEDVGELLAGKRVVVTGGAGTIGAELCRQIVRFGPSRLVVVDIDETRLHDLVGELRSTQAEAAIQHGLFDIRARAEMTALFAEERPDVVFHAAAYKHVPMMEDFPLAALDVNVVGTANVIAAAEQAGCSRFILISTDKAVQPSSVMGASKRLAELLLFADSGRMVRSAVRFGNVIGSRGSVIPTFERQVANGGPVTVTHPDIERYFMMTSEAVSLVLQAAAMGEGGDVFVLEMGRPVKILDVAREFIRLKGLVPDVDVKIVFTGLRRGEKLYEVLTWPDEPLIKTSHPLVGRTKVIAPSGPQAVIDPVEHILRKGDAEGARRHLQEMFPMLGSDGRDLAAASAVTPPPA